MNTTVVILIFIFYIVPAWFVAELAKKKGRNFLFWYLFALLLTPIGGLILILILGETNERRWEKIREDEEIRKSVRK